MISPANPVLSHFIDSFVQRGISSPWNVIGYSSQLQQKHAKAAADFAQSIIMHHPFEFFLKSAPLFFSQLSSYRPSDWVIAHGRFDTVLAPLFTVQTFLYRLNWLFPFVPWPGWCCSVTRVHAHLSWHERWLYLCFWYALSW